MSEESNIFSICAQKTKYSKYAFSLDRLFKNNSLNCLQEKLRHPVYYKPKEEKLDDGIKQLKAFKNEKEKINTLASLPSKAIGNNKMTKRKGNEGQIEKTDKEDREISFKEFIEEQRQKK